MAYAVRDGAGTDKAKRNYLLDLFRVYSSLPFIPLLSNFSKVYNDTFLCDKANAFAKFQLTEIQLIERWDMDDFRVVFTHSYHEHTSRQVSYVDNPIYREFLKTVLTATKQKDQEKGVDLHARGEKKEVKEKEPA